MSVRIHLENVGPVRKGTVSLKPLTTLIGPNNSGKSYVAMLTYAAHTPILGRRRLRTGLSSRIRRPLLARRRSLVQLDRLETTEEVYLSEVAVHPRNFSLVTRPPPAIKEFLQQHVTETLLQYAIDVGDEIERCFGSELKDLLTRPGRARNLSVSVSQGRPRWRIHLRAGGAGSLETVVDTAPSVAVLLHEGWQHWERSLQFPRGRMLTTRQVLLELIGTVEAGCFSEFPGRAYYLPAARSGILQSHKALAGVVMGRASLAGLEPMEIPQMSGVVGDFISLLLTLDPQRRTGFESVARFLEGNLLEGGVRIRGEPPTYPEISYEMGSCKLPLHRTSSMVSELAPVVLFLRYLVKQGDLLIIEEPESHLHPWSQLRFAKALGRVLSGGAFVQITTHSDYFLTQLNNQIRASALSPSERKRQGVLQVECVNSSDVSACLFRRQRGGATVIEQIPVDPKGGIQEEEFAAVAESLYSETVRLQRSVEKHANQ